MSDKKHHIRKYEKIFRWDNYTSNTQKDLPLNSKCYIQEKLDGSNVTIELFKDEPMRIYSRRLEIDQENPENWQPLVDWAKATFVDRLHPESSADKVTLHGEWLMMGYLGYNKSLRNTFWLFDSSASILGSEIMKMPISEWIRPGKVAQGLTKDREGLNKVPFIDSGKTLVEYANEGFENFYVGKKSAIDENVTMEGIVVKTFDGEKVKFVSDEFKEKAEQKKGQFKNKQANGYEITALGSMFSKARIEKYIGTLRANNLLPADADETDHKNWKTIFKHQGMLLQDLLDEEEEAVWKVVKKSIGKLMNKEVRIHLETKGKVDTNDEQE